MTQGRSPHHSYKLQPLPCRHDLKSGQPVEQHSIAPLHSSLPSLRLIVTLSQLDSVDFEHQEFRGMLSTCSHTIREREHADRFEVIVVGV